MIYLKNQITILINEGNKLKSTFTEEAMIYKMTNDRQAVSKWVTTCMRIVEKAERQKEKSPIYIKFSNSLNSVNSEDFNQLVGLMEGINETTEDDDVFTG